MDKYGCLYMYVHACTLLQACYVSFYNIPICMLSAKSAKMGVGLVVHRSK